MSLLYTCTCFEHHVIIIRRSTFYYTASGIIKPVGGRPVRRLREESSVPCTSWERSPPSRAQVEGGVLRPVHRLREESSVPCTGWERSPPSRTHVERGVLRPVHRLREVSSVPCTGWERGPLSRTHVEIVLSQPVHRTATYRCDDTRGCVIQFWLPYDEHIVLETCRGMK